ncbi:MAG: succinylglutamate desuccinylase/aspartoacylase family protein [Acidimicrobiia bacterium]|nr:succinylglutamate desuccinylase/aspartoacylase family protein [Acidimicrobiia bacterium]
MSRAARPPFQIAEQSVRAGRRAKLELPIARLMSGTPVALPVIVVHGRHEGPTLWLTAALHGDELCGIDIIRRVLAELDARTMAGTVLAVPVVNVHGFNTGDRYLPDRRDLNRSFPGSGRGSLASRIAHLLMSEIIARADVGIDLHTGSDHRINLPQIRADLDDPKTRALAEVFAAPIAVHSRTRDGSLRQAATEAGSTVLLYEGGEADRFDERAIQRGTEGVARVIDHLGIVDMAHPPRSTVRWSHNTGWVRASRSGILHLDTELGDQVVAGDVLATIHDPFGKRLGRVVARTGGMIIGHAQRPLVNRGDAVVHVAELDEV